MPFHITSGFREVFATAKIWGNIEPGDFPLNPCQLPRAEGESAAWSRIYEVNPKKF